MTPIADMVEAMLAKGMPADVIVLAIRAAELSTRNSTGIPPDAAAEKRRAWDRQRKRSKVNSTGIPPEIPPETENRSFFKEEKKEERKKERAKRKTGTPIPPDWKPSERHEQQTIELGRDIAWMQRQAIDLRIWAESNAHRAVARKADWDLTFLGWLRRNAQGPPGRMNGQPLSYRDQKQKDYDDARQALRESIERDEREASGGTFDGLFPANGGSE